MIDVEFRREARGLVMELRAADGADSLLVPEDAFGFVEPCVRGAWPAYAHFGHWGSTTIPHATWSVIVNDMKALRRSLAAAREPSEVEGLGFLFAHLRDEFASDFDANRAGLARMIDALCDWLQAAIARSIDVTIIGV